MSEEASKEEEGASNRRAMSDSRRGRQSATYAELSDDEFLNNEPEDVAKGGGAAEEADDGEESEHDDLCEYCHIGGELLCCDNCTNVYHLKCLEPPLQKLPPGIWNCPDCQFTCEREKCRANGGEMQCCCCGRRFHLACTGQGGALPTPHECASWTCTGCLSSFGVDKLLWRRPCLSRAAVQLDALREMYRPHCELEAGIVRRQVDAAKARGEQTKAKVLELESAERERTRCRAERAIQKQKQKRAAPAKGGTSAAPAKKGDSAEDDDDRTATDEGTDDDGAGGGSGGGGGASPPSKRRKRAARRVASSPAEGANARVDGGEESEQEDEGGTDLRADDSGVADADELRGAGTQASGAGEDEDAVMADGAAEVATKPESPPLLAPAPLNAPLPSLPPPPPPPLFPVLPLAPARKADEDVQKSGGYEVLVKWKDRPYRDATWLDEDKVKSLSAAKLRNFLRAQENFAWGEGDEADLAMLAGEDVADGLYGGGRGGSEEGGMIRFGMEQRWLQVHRVVAQRACKPEQDKLTAFCLRTHRVQGKLTCTIPRRMLLVKWCGLGYDECTWEIEDNLWYGDDVAAIQHFEQRQLLSVQLPRQILGVAKSTKRKRGKRDEQQTFQHFKAQPEWLSTGANDTRQLFPYQLEGLNWLCHSFHEQNNVILADEMGLGKTVQTAAFLRYVSMLPALDSPSDVASHDDGAVQGPFLIVVPLSTVSNWERELELWCPQLDVVVYLGNAVARETIRKYDMWSDLGPPQRGGSGKASAARRKRDFKPHVILTSYEIASLDVQELRRPKYSCVVVDEGHRLKRGTEGKLFQALRAISTQHRLLLTGTPLQNNIAELFFLLHFLEPDRFGSLEEFADTFSNLDTQAQVEKLHKLLTPHMLRRTKRDVDLRLPQKKELIVRVELTKRQRDLYRSILVRNYETLASKKQKSGGGILFGGGRTRPTNIVMELKKCCNHPYLFDGAESTKLRSDPGRAHRALVAAAGKMKVLDRMLIKLRKGGHRVLLFSQMTRMLDVIEDYIVHQGDSWGYERLDGSVSLVERQKRIDRFNAKPSTDKGEKERPFIFLLSTRAGGLGINLASADTVIIYDSDWNPHNDMQALARSHRIGQENTVLVYRFVTRASVEERILQLGKKKMMLEHMVVRNEAISQDELNDVLKFGATELFEADEVDDDEEEEPDEARDSASGGGGAQEHTMDAPAHAEVESKAANKKRIVWTNSELDMLLDRSVVASSAEGDGAEASSSGQKSGGLNALFSSFKVAKFVSTREEEAGDDDPQDEDPDAAQADADADQPNKSWDELLEDGYTVSLPCCAQPRLFALAKICFY